MNRKRVCLRGISFLLRGMVLGLLVLSGTSVNAVDLSKMSALLDRNAAQYIFDVNDRIMLIGKLAAEIIPESGMRPVYDLWMIDRQTAQATLIQTGKPVLEASLSPVDQRIAYLTQDDVLWLIEPLTGKSMKLSEGALAGIAWSPDGSMIAFSGENLAEAMPNPDIFVVPITGLGGKMQLTNHPGTDQKPVWSPDGKELLFVSGRTSLASLWAINVDGTNLRQVTNKGLIGGKGKLPKGFIPVPALSRGIKWSKQGTIYLHSGDGIWVVQRSDGKTDRSLTIDNVITAKKLGTANAPASIFMLDQTLMLFEKGKIIQTLTEEQ